MDIYVNFNRTLLHADLWLMINAGRNHTIKTNSFTNCIQTEVSPHSSKRTFSERANFSYPWTWAALLRMPKISFNMTINCWNRYSPYVRRHNCRWSVAGWSCIAFIKSKWKNSPIQELLLNAISHYTKVQVHMFWFAYWIFFFLSTILMFRIRMHIATVCVVKVTSPRSKFMRTHNNKLIRSGRQASTSTKHGYWRRQ